MTSLSDQVRRHDWYHTIDLSDGVVTPGIYDLRNIASAVLPDDLSGKRCLDAATANGFWAFEMESRGAAEVVGIDVSRIEQRDYQLEHAAQHGSTGMREIFEVAKAGRGSSVKRVECSLYDANPDTLGEFDFVFIGTVLLHLRDPVRALRALTTVTRGELRSFEVRLWWVSKLFPGTPMARLAEQEDSRWWTPNRAAHRRWMTAAGLEIAAESGDILQPFGPAGPRRVPRGQWRHPGRALSLQTQFRRGVPSAWIAGTPIR